MRLKEFFSSKPFIAVIHLDALPGAPLYGGDFQSVMDKALRDARIAEEGGADAVIVENFGDKPFREKVDSPTIAAMALIVKAIVEELSISVGVNVLRNDAVAALSIATVCGADFIRVNAYTELVASDQGFLRPAAWDVLTQKRLLDSNVTVFADIRVKHGVSLSARDAVDAARAATYRGLADALIVTGRETGAEADPAVLRKVKAAVDRPVLVGSGITPSNAQKYSEADGYIVGTYLHENSEICRPLSLNRVRKMAEAIKKLKEK